MRTRLLSLIILLAIALPTGAAQTSSTRRYTYCVLIDNVHSAIYFSEVFPGSLSRNALITETFRSSIQKTAPRLYGAPNCVHYGDDIYTVRHQKESLENHVRSAYRNFVETGWSY